MTQNARTVRRLVEAQQQDFGPATLEHGVGLLLIDMAGQDETAAGILARDLTVEEMGLKQAGAKLYEHAKKNRGGSSFYMDDATSRRLLREFYHIPDAPAPRPKAVAFNPLDYLED